MLPNDPISTASLVAAIVLLFTWLVVRARQRQPGTGSGRRSTRFDAIDTVAGWPPEAARVLTTPEAQAYDLLKAAMPGFLVLAQVPLSRFIRVPMRNSYTDWLQRVGHLNADLLLCDARSRVLAVVDVRTARDSDRSRRRHDRMVRVLRAANVVVYTWREDELPSLADVRRLLGAQFGREAQLGAAAPAEAQAAPSPRAMPLIPVPEITEVLADGDLAAANAEAMEPVASAFFDDLEMQSAEQRAA
jgi:hypothetical protein